MSNYTEQQYAESARKYGITPGPWHFNGSRYVRSGIHPNTTTVCQFGDVGSTIESDDENEANGNATASVPNLLIERDALKAENERLRKAMEAVADSINASCGNVDDARWDGLLIDIVLSDDEARDVVAALKGGA